MRGIFISPLSVLVRLLEMHAEYISHHACPVESCFSAVTVDYVGGSTVSSILQEAAWEIYRINAEEVRSSIERI